MTSTNMSSTDDKVQETLNTETLSIQEVNMTRAKLKMEEVREENERLKLRLSQVMKDYSSLKKQFNGITQEDESKKETNLDSMAASDDESELVCLSLGRSTRKIKINTYNLENGKLELGLNCSAQVSRNLRSENSLDESKEDDVRSSPKHSRSNGDEEILQHNPLKKPRVSVRAVCNTQTMHDGCQWRKYGQKIAKGNPCPRAYYRCTVSSSCPVRKQVQRCIDDMSILITTYEGAHNHPLAASAAPMASATSSAATMLSCGSTPFGYKYNPNFPRATISSSQSHPTVILDLTAPNHHKSTTPTSFNFSSAPYSQPPLFSGIQNDQKIAAAIAHDPNFQSALAAAFTSIVGKNNTNNNNGHGIRNGGMNFHHLDFAQASSTSSAAGCAASFMNRFPQAVNSQQTNFAPLQMGTASKSRAMSVALADEGQQMKL